MGGHDMVNSGYARWTSRLDSWSTGCLSDVAMDETMRRMCDGAGRSQCCVLMWLRAGHGVVEKIRNVSCYMRYQRCGGTVHTDLLRLTAVGVCECAQRPFQLCYFR